MLGTFSKEGKCLCGAVTINAADVTPDVTACHCAMCLRWSAGPFLEVTSQHVKFEGIDNISRIRSSEWAERGFCSQCGSNLFYHIIDSDDYQLSVGLFEDQSKFRMSMQVFVDVKPAYYEFSGKTDTMTSEEVFKAYGPTES